MIKAQVLQQSAGRNLAPFGHLFYSHIRSPIQLYSLGILLLAYLTHPSVDIVIDAQLLAELFPAYQNIGVVYPYKVGQSCSIHSKLAGHLRHVQVDVLNRVACHHCVLIFLMCQTTLSFRRIERELLSFLAFRFNVMSAQHQFPPVTAQVSS